MNLKVLFDGYFSFLLQSLPIFPSLPLIKTAHSCSPSLTLINWSLEHSLAFCGGGAPETSHPRDTFNTWAYLLTFFFFFLVTLTALLSNQLWSCVSNFSSVEIALHLKSWAPSVLCLFEIWAVLTTLLLYSLNLHCDLPRMSFSYLIFLNEPGVEDPAGSGS